jgi:acyl-CoA hydrolase
MPTLSNESALVRDELLADPERADGVTFMGVQFPGIDRTDYLALHPKARQVSWFMSPALRRGLADGRAELLSQDYIGIVRHLATMPPVDLACAQLTPPDSDGWCHPGLSCDFLPLVWRRAKRRAAHINPLLPRLPGSFRVHLSELAVLVEAEAGLNDFSDLAAGETEQRIAAHVASVVQDGDTLQFGIGAVPLAAAKALASHRRLRFRSGMATTAVQALWESGALDRDAPIVTGVILGDAPFRDFVGELKSLWLTDVSHTHNPTEIASTPRFIAVNGAVEVDLFGQVNAERAAGSIQAGSGGLPAFGQGALGSVGGRLIVCLPSTTRRGSISRIVPTLDAQAICTLPRWMSDVVITEHGIAELRGLAMEARAQALIEIAAPEHRGELEQAWSGIRSKA